MSVRVVQLTKAFGKRREVVGVDQVSFSAPDHAITSLVGPSGSGKSTLLRLVAGLESPDSGQVFLGEEEITHTPVRHRNIGFVFQNYALFRHMSVFDNVGFGLSVRGVKRAAQKERVMGLLELVQLQDYAERLPDQLSGGQRQRVALARALATEPRLLLLDEPFGALDTRVRIELRDWLLRLHDQTQVTTLLVTHDQDEALELSEHVVLLRAGQVEQAGSPAELYEAPRTAFAAEFLGGAKILTGQVESGQASFAEQGIVAEVDHADGEIHAIVRPHDVRLESADSSSGRLARVERVVRVGAFVKVAVQLNNGDILQVQMSRHEQAQRGLEPGDTVRVSLGPVQVLSRPNYAI